MTNEDPAASGPGGTPPRKSPRKGVGGSPVGSTLSIVLAVVAVIAGFLILRNITDDDDGSSSAVDDPTEQASTTSAAVGVDTTTAVPTTTVPPIVTQGATVVVANSSGVPGSAGRMSTELAAAGFTMAEATNATSGQLEQSIVYYDPAVAAAQAVAGSVATLMGGLTVEPVPAPPPIEGGALNGSGVVVMLGTTQADKTLAELGGTTAATPETGTAPPVAGTETTVAPETTAAG